MRSTALLITSLILSTLAPTLVACSSEEHENGHPEGFHSQQGLPPPSASEPERAADPPVPAPAPEPPPEPPPSPEVEQEFNERKAALANVGKAAFEALKAGEFVQLRKLTPLDDGPVREVCPDLRRADPVELEAKFDFCHRKIDWAAIAEAQVFAGKPTGEPAAGCDPGIEDYGRLQLYLHMNDGKTIWRVDFYGAVGADGKALGIEGSLSCMQVDDAPPL